MKTQIILGLVNIIAEKVLNDSVKLELVEMIKRKRAEGIDKILDKLEDHTIETHNKIDDALILPLCGILRLVLNVPDND